jgi:hypothetical protein
LEEFTMLRRSCFALFLALAAASCNNDSTTPATTSVQPKFTATLSPTNEVPAVTNADAGGSGSVTAAMTTAKDSSGNVTTASVDFTVNLAGFPPAATAPSS